MLSALIPMVVDSVLNGREIRLGDGSFSDGQGQHSHYIAKRMRGRQQKMKKNEKISWWAFGQEFGQILG